MWNTGSPNYLILMWDRAGQYSSVLPSPSEGPPTFPKALIDLIQRTSPGRSPSSGDSLVKGKKVLVLSGGADPLVPWKFSRQFVDELKASGQGKVEVIVEPEAKHEVTPTMVQNVVRFVWDEVLSEEGSKTWPSASL